MRGRYRAVVRPLRSRRFAALLPVFIVLWIVLFGTNRRSSDQPLTPEPRVPPVAAVPAPAPSTKPAPGFGAAVGFRSEQRLVEHFEKHGREFGAANAAEYLAIAQGLRDRPAGGEVLELSRADGVTCRFDRTSGTFLAFHRDGTLRTCFKPHDGERYFERQTERP